MYHTRYQNFCYFEKVTPAFHAPALAVGSMKCLNNSLEINHFEKEAQIQVIPEKTCIAILFVTRAVLTNLEPLMNCY